MNKPKIWASYTLPNIFTELYSFIMLAIFPLFTGLTGYQAITDSKFWFFAAATGLWLILLAGYNIYEIIRQKKSLFSVRQKKLFSANKAYLRKISPVFISLIIFALISCLSALVSGFDAKTILLGAGRHDGLITALLYCAVFFGVSLYGRLRDAHFFALGASVAIICVIAILQLFNLNPLWLFPGNLNYHDAHYLFSSVVISTIGNADLFSAFVCLTAPLFAALLVTRGDKFLPLMLPCALSVFVLTASGVSGGAVALSAAALLFMPLLIKNISHLRRYLCVLTVLGTASGLALSVKWPEPRHGIRFAVSPTPMAAVIFALCAALCALALLTLMIPSLGRISLTQKILWLPVLSIILIGALVIYFYPGGAANGKIPGGGTLFELSRVLRGDVRDSFGSSRILIWRETLSLIKARPILGGGPGTIAARLDIPFTRYVPETGVTLSTVVTDAHNEFLGYWANIGILGLLCYLAAIVFSVRRFYKGSAKKPGGADVTINPAGSARILLLPLLCYWLQSFFGIGQCLVAPLLWLVWGLFNSNDKIINTQIL